MPFLRSNGLQTIKDVAAMAGVSDRTVSRVVNGEPNISVKTRARVEEAIKALNYIPNLAARMVRSNRSGLIGLITDVVTTTPYSVEIIRGIQDRVSGAKQNLLIANTAGDPEQERRVWRTFQEHRIDGVLLATMYHHEVDVDPVEHSMPTVLANCTARGREDVAAFVPNDYQGGAAAAQHAIDCGHTRIGFLTLHPSILAARLRRAAFDDVMARNGVPIRAEWIRPAYKGEVGRETICAYEAARALLDAPTDQRPTALLAGDDGVAMQCMFAAQSLGLQVPRDVAIIGFDDFQMISTKVVPQLTTVALPYYEIGFKAADRLLSILAGEALPARIERLDCALMRRESC